jgi:hypothetical protein
MKIISLFLPQFHPIPENNQWWGEGFTEWYNVVKGRPHYKGHHQPQMPGELGFYDLRCRDTRFAQFELAREYGIDAFCYYHYWFNGKLVIERPVEDHAKDPSMDFPFCVCWANENWTRAWDGMSREVLLGQNYHKEDDITHIRYLATLFQSESYLKVDGKPLFVIYRSDGIPNGAETIATWREEIKNLGFPDLYLCAFKSNFPQKSEEELIAEGYDAIIDFQPNLRNTRKPDFTQRLKGLFYRKLNLALKSLGLPEKSSAIRHSYRSIVESVLAEKEERKHKFFPCAFPTWDNSVRRKIGSSIQNEDPQLFQKWMEKNMEQVEEYPEAEQLVFINAWNEWAEGCHLEPDQRYGRIWLEAVKCARETKKNSSATSSDVRYTPRRVPHRIHLCKRITGCF